MKTINSSGAKEELVLTQEEIALVVSFRKLSDEAKGFASAFMVRFASQCPRNDRPRLQVIAGGKRP